MSLYWGKQFFEFFALLWVRFIQALRGDVVTLASDEVQVLVLVGVAISASLVGTFLVLKRMTMLANSLSHTILIGLVIAFVLSLSHANGGHFGLNLKILMIASVVTALLTVFFTDFLERVIKLPKDASIGLVFTTLFALGVTLVTLFARNSHLEVEAVMGNVDALHAHDVKLMAYVAGFNLVVTLLFYKEYKVTAFSPSFSATIGISPFLFNFLLMIQTAGTAIGAFRAVGVLLVLAFLVMPPLAARFLTHHLGRLIWVSAGIGILASLLAVAMSRHILTVYAIPVSTAGLVVCFLGALYFISYLSKLTFRAFWP